MSRLLSDHVLLVGDAGGDFQRAVSQVMPSAKLSRVDTWFEAIPFLAQTRVTTILASAEPIERRPESAVRTLRQLSSDSRLILFGDPTLEPLSRKMLQFGCDDYVISPPTVAELGQVLGAPRMRIAPTLQSAASIDEIHLPQHPDPLLGSVPLAEAILEALAEAPQRALEAAVEKLSGQLGPQSSLAYTPAGQAAPAAPEGKVVVSHAVRCDGSEAGHLHLIQSATEDANAARHLLSRLALLAGRLRQIQNRQTALQKLAVTDELTGLHNGRYFRNFLGRVLELAKVRRFPVTLFIFDIDNFKHYNDQYGHGTGDIILRETAQLMKRCCREHDLVARIGGDEFAVVFWEKEGPRVPRQPGAAPRRPPETPVDILNRFRRLLAAKELANLGPSGKGTLTISGGIAIYPYDAWTAEQLIAAADAQLMQRAKKAGKNSIYLVGSEDRLQ
jgi:GGDEF domain-containing protein